MIPGLLHRVHTVLRDRPGFPLALSILGLALMLAVLVTAWVRAGQGPLLNDLRLAGLIVGSLLAISGSYYVDSGWARGIRWICGGQWLGMEILGLAFYSADWFVAYRFRFLLTGALVSMSAYQSAPGRQGATPQTEATMISTERARFFRIEQSRLAPAPWMSTLFVGLLAGLICLAFRLTVSPGAGDFHSALDIARSLLSRQDPYGFAPTALTVPYPLPAALFGLPLLAMPPAVAAAVFFGFSAALLSYGILRADQPWRLLLFFSSSIVGAAMWAQWSPLITAAWFFPILAPLLVLVKPQIALPVALNRLTWRGLLLASIVLTISLVVYPGWPLQWIQMTQDYQRIIPVLMLPLGPLLLLAALFPRDPRARLLLLMSVLPMRADYDLLPLFLVPSTRRQMLILVALSLWNPLMALFSRAGYPWPQGINSLHFYALCILLWSNVPRLRATWQDVKRKAAQMRRDFHGKDGRSAMVYKKLSFICPGFPYQCHMPGLRLSLRGHLTVAREVVTTGAYHLRKDSDGRWRDDLSRGDPICGSRSGQGDV